jgi:hypothetical protein
MAMNGKRIPRVKIVINNKIIEQVTQFIYLGSHLSQYNNQKDIDRNLTKYNRLNGTLKRNFGKQMRKKFSLDSITSFQNQRSYMTVHAGPFVKETNPE